MSYSNNSNNNDMFPYGKYPTNIVKLFEIAEKNSHKPDNKEKKLLLCMAWCKERAPKFQAQELMEICVASYKMKGKFLHEMNNKEEVDQTLDEMIEEYYEL